jgi:membrane-bound lytic murein transglycosylase
MSEKEEKPILTGPHDSLNESDQKEAKDDEEITELNNAIDVSQDMVSWARTPAGQDTINRLRNEARKSLNELFSVLHENPELGKLISAVARFEAAIQMTRRFTGAEDDLDTLLSELSRKRPSVTAELAK